MFELEQIITETNINAINQTLSHKMINNGDYACIFHPNIPCNGEHENIIYVSKIQEFNKDEIIIPDDVIAHIVDNHCNKEDGVRNLKRCLEIIYTKLNLYRLMKPGTNLFEEDMSLKVQFPFTVTKDVVDKLIKRNTDSLSLMHSLYA